MILDEMIQEIKNANKIAILTHVNPDGDAIGSSLGMYNALKSIDKQVDVIIPELPKTFAFLPSTEKIKKESNEVYDLVIGLDCATEQRLADPSELFEKAKLKMQIDHHVSNSMYADVNYVDPVAPACCQILIKVLNYWKIEIDKNIGKCLLTGLITDTGGFAYEGVTSETFEMVARLLEKGINISKIYKRVLQTKTKSNFEITKIVTNRMHFYEDGKIAFSYITKEDRERTGAQTGDHEGCVDIGRNIEGVEVSIFAREDEAGTFKISMRSNEYVNVSDICLMFGGGGHIRAAGCTIANTTIEHIRDKIIMETKTYLK